MSKDDARSPVMWGDIRNLISGADGLIDIQTDRVVKYIEVRDDDNRQPDTPAVDREALAEWLYTELEWQGDPDSHWESLRSQDLYRWRAIAGQLLEHWGILDAAAVRHEHGERIAKTLAFRMVGHTAYKHLHKTGGACTTVGCDCQGIADCHGLCWFDMLLDKYTENSVERARHEHGERIADAVMPKLVDAYGTNGFPVRLLRQALGYVLSPAPKAKP